MEHLEYTLHGMPVTWVHVQTEEDPMLIYTAYKSHNR